MRDFEARRQIVYNFYKQWKRDWLKNHPGQKEPRVWNYSLRDYIYVTKLSRLETAFHAAIDLFAIQLIKTNFDDILKYAKKQYEASTKADDHNQRNFSKLSILEKELEKATVKLTVGISVFDGRKVQYSITRIDMERPRRKRKGTPRASLRTRTTG